MSINVTVTGNPISIQKGKMVTASPNHSKKEYERRRLIRISQVRQQSKNIAEDVRNRVKRQKLKQIEDIEQEGQRKLKQWQAKKLLELQNQCHEALKDIGAGHKEAMLLEDEEKILLDKKENDDKAARKRAEIATSKMLEEKDKANHDASVLLLKKKSVREIENKRAQMVSCSKQTSNSSTKIPKTTDKLSNTTEVSGIVTDSDYEEVDESFIKTQTANVVVEVLDDSKNVPQSEEATNKQKDVLEKEIINLSDNDDQLLKELREQKDTRISDRIKKRSSHQLLQPDLCDTFTNTRNSVENLNKDAIRSPSNMFSSIQQNIYACSCSKRTPVVRSSPTCCATGKCIPPSKKPSVSNINHIKCFDTTDDDEIRTSLKSNAQKTSLKTAHPSFTPKKRVPVKDIPTRPKVTLKSVKSPHKTTTVSSSQTSVQNKSSRSRFIASHVERIQEDSLIISPEPRNNDEFLEKIRQRDRDALLRGQKALEKERLQREYNEMLKKLPVLQKLERLYEMNQDKPEYHMTEDRLREKERKKQSVLENTYEKLFPDRRPSPVTIPVKNPPKPSSSEKDKIVISDNSPTLNLSSWETHKKSQKLYTAEEVEELLREGRVPPSDSKFKTEQLKSVLEKLRKQKEEILKELKNQNLAEALPFATSSKKKDGNSTESSTSGDNKKKGKSEKKFKSVKVGTNYSSSSSSYDTIEEPVEKKSPKSVSKSKSKSVQVAVASKKSKSPGQKKSSKVVVKEQKSKKESSKPSGKSDSDLKSSSSKESVKSRRDSGTKTNKLKENVEVGRSAPSKSSKVDADKNKKRAEKDIVDATPSVPSNSLISVNNDPVMLKKISDHIKSCDCEKDVTKSELCEIVIKIKDGKSSEVRIKDGVKNKKQPVIVEKPKKIEKIVDSSLKRRVTEIEKALKDGCCSGKPESWHDKFSKNNSQVSTSSTSYLSPPVLPNKKDGEVRNAPYFSGLIGKKPQQLNLNGSSLTSNSGVENPVLGEVQKLLAMSRQSVEELGVSSVSTVTTPSQSVIDMESNRINTNTTGFSTNTTNTDRSRSNAPNFSFLTISSEGRTVVASEIDSNEPYPDIVAKYARIADQCSRRISDLTSMIEKVREDKNRMLQTSSLLSNNDSSTKYMEIPSLDKSSNARDTAQEQKSTSGSSSGDSKLLDINFSLAEKLKGLTPEEVRNFGKDADVIDVGERSKTEEELLKRFRALKEAPTSNINGQKDTGRVSPPKSSSNNVDFVPLLLDIPKMPALGSDNSNTKHKKPPPSKSFLAARKYTDFAVPHELSTIPEQDSQLRIESIVRDKSPKQVVETISPPKKSPTLENKINTKADSDETNSDNVKSKKMMNKPNVRANSSPIANQSKSSSKTKDNANTSDYSYGSSNTSCDDKIEMLRIEAMLRSIGMDWAISTLRKTHEALALTSSSSSIDMKSPCTLNHLSDRDIKELISQQILQKISSSTLRTDASPGSLNESQDISDIYQSEFMYKQTSTPVNRSRELQKNNEKSSDLPSAIESDKMTNEFYSLPDTSP